MVKTYLNGSIIELEHSSSLNKYAGKVYFESLGKLYKFSQVNFINLCDLGSGSYYKFCLNGIWIRRENENGHLVEHYVDVFNVGNSYRDLDLNLGARPIVVKSSLIVGFDYKSEPSFLYVYNLKDNTLKKVDHDSAHFSSDGEHIYVKDASEKKLLGFDLELKQLLAIKLEGMDYGYWTQTPQLFEDLVLVNHAFNIIAFRKDDGQEVWRHSFDSICGPTCCNLIGNRLYAECFGIGYVIDPRNGEIIHEIPLGFLSSRRRQCVGIHFYPFQEKLVALSEQDESVRVFSGDGSELLQELQCPKEYKISPNNPPVITEDAIYQSVYSKMASAGGVLVLSASHNNVDRGINIQPRPEIHIIQQAAQENKHAYNVYVDAQDADTLNRYGQIAIKEIHMETGTTPYSDYLEYDWRDRQHNGQINFFADPSQCGETEKKRIQSDMRKLEAYFDGLDQKAGDGISAIKINVLFKPKSEWDLSGEPLDINQLRETRWVNESA